MLRSRTSNMQRSRFSISPSHQALGLWESRARARAMTIYQSICRRSQRPGASGSCVGRREAPPYLEYRTLSLKITGKGH